MVSSLISPLVTKGNRAAKCNILFPNTIDLFLTTFCWLFKLFCQSQCIELHAPFLAMRIFYFTSFQD